MAYVDGYVLPVPKKKLQAYRRMAQMGAGFGASTAPWSSGNALATTST